MLRYQGCRVRLEMAGGGPVTTPNSSPTTNYEYTHEYIHEDLEQVAAPDAGRAAGTDCLLQQPAPTGEPMEDRDLSTGSGRRELRGSGRGGDRNDQCDRGVHQCRPAHLAAQIP